MRHPGPKARGAAGFTLVELLIVVIILGVLAAVVIPTMGGVTDDTRITAFATEMSVLADAAERYQVVEDSSLPDTSSGVWPTEWDGYIRQDQFEAPTPLGGVWDTELNSFGVVSAVGAHFNGGDVPADADLAAVDLMMDDGDITTGKVRKLADDRFYYVLEE